MKISKLNYLDLFAGAGGLSEGFIRAAFNPIAHIESDQAASYTLKTRISWHWLKEKNKEDIYINYLENKISRDQLYSQIPAELINSVINVEINNKTLDSIFNMIDLLLGSSRLNLIIGGPPCQAYSLVGRSRVKNRMKGDKRNDLYKYYAEFLKRYEPEYFLFENVTGLLSAKDENGNLYFNLMQNLFHEAGYEMEYMILRAADYGILQNRKRIILVGKHGKTTGFFPEPDKLNSNILVKEIFSDLPALHAGQGTALPCKTKPYKGKWLYNAKIKSDYIPVTWHNARPHSKQDLEIYKIAVELWNKKKKRLSYDELPTDLKTHNNRHSFTDRFKVVAADMPFCHTIVAHIAKDGHYYIHPDIDQNRSLTPREAARLQTFPDDYFFESSSGIPSRTAAFKQIGNAVPVLLAEKIAQKLMERW